MPEFRTDVPPSVLLAPLVLHDQVIVAVLTFGGDVTESIAGDVEHFVIDPKDPARVFAFRVSQPGGQTGEVLTVEQADDCSRAGRFGPRLLAVQARGRRAEHNPDK